MFVSFGGMFPDFSRGLDLSDYSRAGPKSTFGLIALSELY